MLSWAWNSKYSSGIVFTGASAPQILREYYINGLYCAGLVGTKYNAAYIEIEK